MRPPMLFAAALAFFGASLIAAERPAEARIMDLRVGADAGGMVGWGSTSNTPDFFEETSGGGLGFNLGFKILIFDASASFLQVLNGSGTVGTLTQFQLGILIDVPVGREKMPDGKSRNVLHPGLSAGLGFGTPGPVDPPLNNEQVSDKGVVTNLKFGYEYFLNPFMGVGFTAIAGYHYFLGGQVVTMSQDHSSGYHLAGLGNFTFHLGF
jgi:hypothetical protein